MKPSIERVVNEYARLRKEAFQLKKLIEDVPGLRNEFRAFLDDGWSDTGAIEQSNSPAGNLKSNLVVATILDEFSSDNWTPEFCNVMLSRDNWRREIDYFQPDLLFVESAWNGNYSEWSYALEAPRRHSNARQLDSLLEFCRARGVPTLFWNKEDPLHFEKFIDAAGLFDLVFTTDSDSIQRYQRHLGHDRVFVLPFAAQPALCNPVKPQGHFNSNPFFAGSYYAQDHGTRTEQMAMMLDALSEVGGVIYDRSYHSDSPDVKMPDKYVPICLPPVAFDQIIDVYKRHSCAVNVNSITTSPSMMSRRVFEVLSCARPVVSTSSRAIEALLEDVVDVVATNEEAVQAFAKYSNNEAEAEKRGHIGHRKIMQEHTYNHRLHDIAAALDQSVQGAQFSRLVRGRPDASSISLVLSTDDVLAARKTLGSIAKQVHRDFDVILLAGPSIGQNVIDILQDGLTDFRALSWGCESEIGELVRVALREFTGDTVCLLQDCDLYGPHFLGDMLLPLRYTEADIIGKSSYFAFLPQADETRRLGIGFEHRYTDTFDQGPILMTKRAAGAVTPLIAGAKINAEAFANAGKLGLRLYSCDPFNVIRIDNSTQSASRNGTLVAQDIAVEAVFI